MRLHPLPSDGRFYCGPAAIAAFTGEHPKGRVREVVNAIRERVPTRGIISMQTWEVQRALVRFGFRAYVERPSLTPLPTLKDIARRYPNAAMVLRTHNHFVACLEGMLLDNKSRVARPAEFFDGNRARVREIIFVEPMQKPHS